MMVVSIPILDFGRFACQGGGLLFGRGGKFSTLLPDPCWARC